MPSPFAPPPVIVTCPEPEAPDTKVSLPAPAERVSLPNPAISTSFPALALTLTLPLLAVPVMLLLPVNTKLDKLVDSVALVEEYIVLPSTKVFVSKLFKFRTVPSANLNWLGVVPLMTTCPWLPKFKVVTVTPLTIEVVVLILAGEMPAPNCNMSLLPQFAIVVMDDAVCSLTI